MTERNKIGEFLVSIAAMTTEQCDRVLALQRDGDKRLFGEIAVDLGFVDKSAIKRFFNLAH